MIINFILRINCNFNFNIFLNPDVIKICLNFCMPPAASRGEWGRLSGIMSSQMYGSKEALRHDQEELCLLQDRKLCMHV